jgi:hypothetical protein
MHRCEALVSQQRKGRRYYEVMFVPCGAEHAELHHKLTRARGGLLLDAVGESYHHLWLCREHHGVAHDQGSAFSRGLLIDGYVTTELGKPHYVGSDEYLSATYGGLDDDQHLRGGELP